MIIQWFFFFLTWSSARAFGEGGGEPATEYHGVAEYHTLEAGVKRVILSSWPECTDLTARPSPGCRVHLSAFSDYPNSWKDLKSINQCLLQATKCYECV